ncbi:hypothetical protein TSAR_011811 [Trichomalopsis sarcophagae]|uniref:C2H2-type domain-containing protein n=1 Tax=Trichomalopsis sarcophagae TaxID=543379 RepID=A0A232F502_9HYME|nr:hypothetical protein TSAR_011811 [Trichomalopsis sarcophagae]
MSVKIISIKTLPKKSQVVTIKQHMKKIPAAPSKDVIITPVQPSKSKELTLPTSQSTQSKKLEPPPSPVYHSTVLSPLNHPQKSKDSVEPTSPTFQSKALSPLKNYPSLSKDSEVPTSPPFQSEALSPFKSLSSKSKDSGLSSSPPFQSKAPSPIRRYSSRSKSLAIPASKPTQPKELGLPTFHIVPKVRKPPTKIFSSKPRIFSKTKLAKLHKNIDDTAAENPLKKIPEKVLSESSSFVEPQDSEKKTPEKLKSKIDSHIEPNKSIKVVKEKLPTTTSTAVLKIPIQMKKDKAPVITVAKTQSLAAAVTKDMPMITNIEEPTTPGSMSIRDMPIISDINQPYNPVPMTMDNMSVITSTGAIGKPIQLILKPIPQPTGNIFKPKESAMHVVLESVPMNPVTLVEPEGSMQVTLEQVPQASTSVKSNVTKIIQKLPKISNITSLANVNIMEYFPMSQASTAIIEPMEFNFDESLLLSHPVETVQNNPGKRQRSRSPQKSSLKIGNVKSLKKDQLTKINTTAMKTILQNPMAGNKRRPGRPRKKPMDYPLPDCEFLKVSKIEPLNFEDEMMKNPPYTYPQKKKPGRPPKSDKFSKKKKHHRSKKMTTEGGNLILRTIKVEQSDSPTVELQDDAPLQRLRRSSRVSVEDIKIEPNGAPSSDRQRNGTSTRRTRKSSQISIDDIKNEIPYDQLARDALKFQKSKAGRPTRQSYSSSQTKVPEVESIPLSERLEPIAGMSRSELLKNPMASLKKKPGRPKKNQEEPKQVYDLTKLDSLKVKLTRLPDHVKPKQKLPKLLQDRPSEVKSQETSHSVKFAPQLTVLITKTEIVKKTSNDSDSEPVPSTSKANVTGKVAKRKRGRPFKIPRIPQSVIDKLEKIIPEVKDEAKIAEVTPDTSESVEEAPVSNGNVEDQAIENSASPIIQVVNQTREYSPDIPSRDSPIVYAKEMINEIIGSLEVEIETSEPIRIEDIPLPPEKTEKVKENQQKNNKIDLDEFERAGSKWPSIVIRNDLQEHDPLADLTGYVILPTEYKKFECVKCQRRFSQKTTITDHMRYFCGKAPNKPTLRVRHVAKPCYPLNTSYFVSAERVPAKQRSREKQFYCSKCNQGFTLKSNCVRHERYECGQNPRFMCPYCQIRCKQTSQIYTHIRKKHPNEQIYVVTVDFKE